MDKTAFYFNSPPKRTVHAKNEKILSVNIQGASLRITVAVPIAMNGTKTPFFAIFKGKPKGSIEKSPPSIFPKGIVGCVQQNA